MKLFLQRFAILPVFLFVFLATQASQATAGFVPSLSVVVTKEAGSVFRYDYTLLNSSTSTVSASTFFLDVSTKAALTSFNNNVGWDSAYNTGDPDVMFTSPSSATDLIPGASGLFTIRSLLGPALKTYLIQSLDDAGTIQGSVSGQILSAAAVPEPATLALMTMGLVSLAGIAYRHRQRDQG